MPVLIKVKLSREELATTIAALDYMRRNAPKRYSECNNVLDVLIPALYPRNAGKLELSAADKIKAFHIGRGCCDGSDADGCTKRRAAEQAIRERAAAHKPREREPDEYEGTEASDAPLCSARWHRIVQKMGRNCPKCGMVA